MIPKSNVHTHTTFCDGKDSAEKMVLSAIDKGLELIGFSGHSYTPFDLSYCMNEEKTEEYKAEILRLKEKYKGKIDILLGIEQDFYSGKRSEGYEYAIGSVHYVCKDGVYIPIDESAERLKKGVDECYGGDAYKLLEDYYLNVSKVMDVTDADIVGHIDLVTKFNETLPLFDEVDKRYRDIVLDTVHTLCKEHRVFEINSGAIYRGARTVLYPRDFILKEIKALGGDIILTSDSHNGDSLCFKFDEEVELAKHCGFEYAKVLTKDGFLDFKL